MPKRLVIDARPLTHGYVGHSKLLTDFLECVGENSEVFLLFQNVQIENLKIDVRRFHIIEEKNKIYKLLPSSVWFQFFASRLIPMHVSWFWAINTLVPMNVSRHLNILCTVHDFVHIDCPSSMTFVNRMFFKSFFKYSLYKADRIHTTTDLALRRLGNIDEQFLQKGSVNRPGVSKQFLCKDYKTEKKQFDFISVGTIEPRKNLGYAIALVEKLRETKEFKDATLLIVGKNGWKIPKGLMETINSKSWIIRRQNLRIEELVESYRQSKYLLLTSYDEGFGLPIIEGLAAGCKIICSNLPVLKEVSSNKALFLKFDEDKDVANIIEFARSEDSSPLEIRTINDYAACIDKELT